MEKIPQLEIKITHAIPDIKDGDEYVYLQMKQGELVLQYFEMYKGKPLKDLYLQAIDRIREQALNHFPL